jgi:hypothetical protein
MSWKQRLVELTLAGGIVGGVVGTTSCMNCFNHPCAGAAAAGCANVARCADENGTVSNNECVLPDGGSFLIQEDGGVN